MSGSRPASRYARLAWAATLLALAALLVHGAVRDFPNRPGMDLYHPWGIAYEKRTDPGIGSPYVHPERFGERLYRVTRAARASSPKLWIVGELWKTRSAAMFEPTATPFYYALLGLLPADYDRAHAVLVWLQYLAALGGVVLLARLGGFARLPAWCIAAAVGLGYTGFGQDVYTGNVNALQFAAFAGLIAGVQGGGLRRHRLLDLLYLPALALLLAFKPNTIWIAAALAVHYALARGPRAFALGAALAVVAAALALAAGAMYLGPQAWGQWLRYAGGGIFYSVDQGNQSLPMLLSEKGGAYGPVAYVALVAAAIGLAFLVAVSRAGKRGDLAAPAALALARDAWFAASVGVLLFCAATPIFWPHYYMLALIPTLYFVRGDRRPDARTALALASFAVLSVPVVLLLNAAHLAGIAYSLLFFAWVPLLAAAVLHAVRVRRALEPAPGAV